VIYLYPTTYMPQNPEGANDTGVLISWNAEGVGNIGRFSMVVPEGSVAINPLNWRTDETPADFAMPPPTEPLFGLESYHVWDFEFFYMNIRENAGVRLERFLND